MISTSSETACTVDRVEGTTVDDKEVMEESRSVRGDSHASQSGSPGWFSKVQLWQIQVTGRGRATRETRAGGVCFVGELRNDDSRRLLEARRDPVPGESVASEERKPRGLVVLGVSSSSSVGWTNRFDDLRSCAKGVLAFGDLSTCFFVGEVTGEF